MGSLGIIVKVKDIDLRVRNINFIVPDPGASGSTDMYNFSKSSKKASKVGPHISCPKSFRDPGFRHMRSRSIVDEDWWASGAIGSKNKNFFFGSGGGKRLVFL